MQSILSAGVTWAALVSFMLAPIAQAGQALTFEQAKELAKATSFQKIQSQLKQKRLLLVDDQGKEIRGLQEAKKVDPAQGFAVISMDSDQSGQRLGVTLKVSPSPDKQSLNVLIQTKNQNEVLDYRLIQVQAGEQYEGKNGIQQRIERAAQSLADSYAAKIKVATAGIQARSLMGALLGLLTTSSAHADVDWGKVVRYAVGGLLMVVGAVATVVGVIFFGMALGEAGSQGGWVALPMIVGALAAAIGIAIFMGGRKVWPDKI